MKTRILIAAVYLLFGVSQPAGAVTLNNGDVAIYNFDFTGQTPSPPYVLGNFNAFFSGVTVGSIATFDFFTELNANGANVAKDGPTQVPTFSISIGIIDPGLLDGIFSVKVSANGDPFDIIQASAIGFFNLSLDPLVTPPVQGELVTPLPSALPLFASGAGLLGYMGWRRKKKAIALAT